MLGSCGWLALDVSACASVVDFYREHLDLTIVEATDTETVLDAGASDVVLRRPDTAPWGGVHTHYAFSIPAGEYDDWWDRLGADFDLEAMDFGGARSLYLDDPAGNCVELGQRDVAGPGIDGIFEIVLEVADLSRAREFYTDLGFDVVDVGDDRPRVRLSTGELDLELWEPQVGIAGGRGGAHVDWGLRVAEPTDVAERVRESAQASTTVEEGVRLLDPDGHVLTLIGA